MFYDNILVSFSNGSGVYEYNCSISFLFYNILKMLKYIYTTLFLIFSLSFSYSSYASILEYENTIIQQWEQLLNEYNQANNTNVLYTDTDAITDVLINLYDAWEIEDMKILSDGFALKNRVSIYEQFTQEQNFPTYSEEELNIPTQNNYSPLANYNRNTAKNYALYWANKSPRNSNYSYYQGSLNGQNFVSQALYAGGVPFDCIPLLINKTLPSCWYYNTLFPANTWWAAHNFYLHAIISDKYTKFNDNNYGRSQMQVWDIVQLDIGNTGTMNQSMMITKKTGNNYNQIFVTYSKEYNIPNNDRKDVSLQEVITITQAIDSPYYALHFWKVNY